LQATPKGGRNDNCADFDLGWLGNPDLLENHQRSRILNTTKPWCEYPALPSLPEDERRVLEVMIPHVGRDKAIGRRALSVAAGFMERTTSPSGAERKAREAIVSLIINHAVPICMSTSATDGGYFMPASKEEVQSARDTIASYVHHQQERLRAYDRALIKQGNLFE
jgi:hypothetical protein|tara:strand:+ start:382 stop:879 length:498 start_codon:yes stop_codon:yes gene_type:complete